MTAEALPASIGTLAPLRRIGTAKSRYSIWLMRCTECGTETERTARQIAAGKPRCPECFPSIARAQEKAILAMLPATHQNMIDKLGMTEAMAHWRSMRMREQDLMHVGDWKRTETVGGSYQPIFYAGPGEDVPCPFKPLSNKARTKRYIAKLKKTDEGKEKIEVRKARTRALYHAAKARKTGDPLVMALFGRAA